MLPLWNQNYLTVRINNWESYAAFYTIYSKSYNLPQPPTPSLPGSLNSLFLLTNKFFLWKMNFLSWLENRITSEHFIFQIFWIFYENFISVFNFTILEVLILTILLLDKPKPTWIPTNYPGNKCKHSWTWFSSFIERHFIWNKYKLYN